MSFITLYSVEVLARTGFYALAAYCFNIWLETNRPKDCPPFLVRLQSWIAFLILTVLMLCFAIEGLRVSKSYLRSMKRDIQNVGTP